MEIEKRLINGRIYESHSEKSYDGLVVTMHHEGKKIRQYTASLGVAIDSKESCVPIDLNGLQQIAFDDLNNIGW